MTGGEGAWSTLTRGLRLAPQLREGLVLTLLLAVVATAGRVIVPVAAQQVIDRGLQAGVDLSAVARYVAVAFGAVVVTAAAGYAVNRRLVTATEGALSSLRVRAFRHIHDLSAVHVASEHRGALVARVTADVDAISEFMQWGGVMLLVNIGQLLFATLVMAIFNLPLTLLVLATFFPLVFVLRAFQRRLTYAYALVRERVGDVLATVSETVVGAPVVRAYGIEERVDARLTRAIANHFDVSYRAGRTAAYMFVSGELFAALATAAVVVVGARAGVGGALTPGQLVAFLFLVSLFVGPVQVASEVLDQAQTAVAGWRRVLDVLDTRPDVADPAERAVAVPPGPLTVRFDDVAFRYPTGPVVLHDVNLELPPRRRVAVVGQTGSGKTTFAKLLARVVDPTNGSVLLNDVPLPWVRFSDLRRRVLLVPQEGFLFDGTIAENVLRGRDGATRADVLAAFATLGLEDWLAQMSAGVDTRVGERGDALSAGERQLVALARAYLADPELLILDEATSNVDPQMERRLQRALERLYQGRTSVTIAHRLSTAETADEVLVFDAGRIAQRGTHDELARQPGPYAALVASWAAQQADVA